jgi:hypothetical protein
MHWECDRDCTEGGFRAYDSPEKAARYAKAFDREDRDGLGKRSILSLAPLRLIRRRN